MTERGENPTPPTRPWESATVVAVRAETRQVRTVRLRFPSPVAFLAGQYYVVRLRAPDGYTAQRSYSIGSAPDGSDELELTVERLADGEVSPFLHDGLEVGDEVEVRGPIGGWFAWRGDTPATLIGGGSGVVPLMSMLRHSRRVGGTARLLVSVRTPQDVIYADELLGADDATVVYTRAIPATSPRPPGRITANDVADVLIPGSTVYLCGNSGFVATASSLVTELGVPADRIRVERFGPT